MKTNDNQYYIYLRSTRERIPCTEQEFHDYYRDIDRRPCFSAGFPTPRKCPCAVPAIGEIVVFCSFLPFHRQTSCQQK